MPVMRRPMPDLSHVDSDGNVRMVDVGAKQLTARLATAEAVVRFSDPATLELLRSGDAAKGDVLATVRIAGVMAAKRTSELIPLCHPIALDHASIDIELDDGLPGMRLLATASCRATTGVEMEALTAVSVAALTVIDMLKSADRWISVESIRLREKSGGRHGRLLRPGLDG